MRPEELWRDADINASFNHEDKAREFFEIDLREKLYPARDAKLAGVKAEGKTPPDVGKGPLFVILVGLSANCDTCYQRYLRLPVWGRSQMAPVGVPQPVAGSYQPISTHWTTIVVPRGAAQLLPGLRSRRTVSQYGGWAAGGRLG